MIGQNTSSEHPPALISTGQAYVTTLVNSIMRSPCWGSTAIFLSWDDWGGFYDHVVPPVTDGNWFWFRVPGLVISPYARAGYIDHQQLSHDAYLKFIEDDFMNGQRLNPATDGRPDSRPDVREEAPALRSLASDFDFCQAPRPPLLLPAHPAPGPASCPPGSVPSTPQAPCLTAAHPAPPAQPAPAPVLQLTASVARRQDLRLHHGRIYLLVGCNLACSLDAHGHVNLRRNRRHLGLRSVRTKLAADRTVRIALSLSHRNLSAVHRALQRHRSVKAAIVVEATGADGRREDYSRHRGADLALRGRSLGAGPRSCRRARPELRRGTQLPSGAYANMCSYGFPEVVRPQVASCRHVYSQTSLRGADC